MKNFDYYAAPDFNIARTTAKQNASKPCKYLAGGTSLVDLMRENIENPEAVIDLSKVPGNIYKDENELVISASVTNTALAAHALVLEHLPLLSSAILSGASGQIRNMATVGGNILQRTRCYYFYDTAAACNKREPGTGCDALEGHNRIHAILGGSDNCIATHPSDMCVALAALDARICIESDDGLRQVNINDFYCLPGANPEIETILNPDEIITEIRIPLIIFAKTSTYQKVRDRASYAFSLLSCAVAIDLDGQNIRDLRIAYGGVAPKPWRATRIESDLKGKMLTESNLTTAIENELSLAKVRKHNAFKIELFRRLTVDAFAELRGDQLK